MEKLARIGLVAQGLSFGLVAADYDAKKARGLDGALRKLAAETCGPWLLGLVAAGLVAFGVFCLIQARYREVRSSNTVLLAFEHGVTSGPAHLVTQCYLECRRCRSSHSAATR